MKGKNDTLEWGTWNVICDRCGFKYKAYDIVEEWTGLRVCKECYEPRHPQDFLRGIPDDPSVEFNRPESVDIIDEHGDVNATITYGTDESIHEWNTTLTDNRVATIETGTAITGNRITIYRTASGSFTLTINATEGGSLQVIPSNIKAIVVIEYTGSAWSLVNYTPLGL